MTVGPAEHERKVVTVLRVELLGLVAANAPAEPQQARLRALVERYGGRIVAVAGTTAVALFGVPAAHEDDPERAVRAALQLRDLLQDDGLNVRIAVDTGEALVTVGDASAAGEVVDRTATLLGATEPGEIGVGVWTYERTHRAIDYAQPTPVGSGLRIWRAAGARARFGVDVSHHARSPLVGREREVELLVQALWRARRERMTELVTLVGATGAGKSRLVHELMAVAEADEEIIYWRQGRSLPYGEGVSYWALGEMVKAQAGIFGTDTSEQAGAKLAEAVAALLPAEEAEWVLGHLRPLAGLGGDVDPRGDRRNDAFAAWRRFLEALAARRPLVLVFEDLHWADGGLLDFVEHAAAWVSGVPLLIVCTARPELLERRAQWAGTIAAVGALTDDETATLVAELALRPLSAATRAELVARAGGNPLYAEQYVRMVEERPDADRLAPPATVEGIVTARLDSLPPGQKALLQDAAVIGKVFWVGAVATISGLARDRVEAALEELGRRELLQRSRRPSIEGEIEYAFRHLLVQEIAYGQLPGGQRAEKHRRVATWIRGLGRPEGYADLLAHHEFSALELARAAGADVAELVGPARAALRDAGDRALALGSFPAAATAYGRALELSSEDDPALPRLLCRLGQALLAAGEDGAIEKLERAHAALLQAGDREAAAEVDVDLAEARWLLGQRDRAFAHLGRARQSVRDSDATPSRARVLAAYSRYQVLASQHEPAEQLAAEALELAESLGLKDLEAHALNTLGLAKSRSGDPTWVADLERSIELAKAANSREAVRAVNNLASRIFEEGELGRAIELWRESRALAERFGARQLARFANGALVSVDYTTGDWNGAMRVAYEFIAECEAGSPHYLESGVRGTRALIRHLRGDPDGALEDARRGLELAREAKDPQALIPELAVLARIAADLEREEEAAACLDEALVLGAESTGARIAALGGVIWVADGLGRRQEARELFAPLSTTPWTEAGLALLGRDFTRAAELYARIGARTYEADARLRAAGQLLAEGRRGACEAELQRALEFFRGVGASRCIAAGETLLAGV